MKCCKRGKAPLEKWLRKEMNEYNSTSVQQKPPEFSSSHKVYYNKVGVKYSGTCGFNLLRFQFLMWVGGS